MVFFPGTETFFFFCDVDIIIKSSLTGFENKIQKHSGYRRKDSVRIVFET